MTIQTCKLCADAATKKKVQGLRIIGHYQRRPTMPRPEKNSFLLHKSDWAALEDLDDDELGAVMRAIYEYQVNDVVPEKGNIARPYFKFFKIKFDKEEENYTAKVSQNAENGRKGGLKAAEARRKRKVANASERLKSQANDSEVKRNIPDKDIGMDRDIGLDNDIVTDRSLSKKEKEKKENEIAIASKAELTPQDVQQFQTDLQDFKTYYGAAGNPMKTERAYIEAVDFSLEKFPDKFPTRKQAQEAINNQAASYQTYCLRVKRMKKDPQNWLSERDFLTDYTQELENHKKTQNGKSQKSNTLSRAAEANRELKGKWLDRQ